MATTTGSIPNPGNTVWKQQGSWNQAKGKAKHAEVQGWDAMDGQSPSGVYLFEQDQAPCETCHPKFLELSANASFIFKITSAGYQIHKGVKAAKQSLLPSGQLSAPEFVVLTKDIMLDQSELPATLYYYLGVAYLGARPNAFPIHPPI